MDDHLLETDVSQLQVSLCQVPFIESSAIVCFCAKGSSFLMSHAEERNTLQPVSPGLMFSQTWDAMNINKVKTNTLC